MKENGMLDNIIIKETGEVEIYLKIDKHFLKIKNTCLTALKSISWIK